MNYLRLSVTDLCNLRCQYCMPKDGIKKSDHQHNLTFEEIDGLVSELIELGVDKVRITGGEPLVRRNIIELITMIGRHNEIKDFAITTNGLLLKSMAKELKTAGIHRVNISLDSMNPTKFEKITRGGKLQEVLDGIEEALRIGLTPVKINVVLIGGFNEDEIVDFVELTKDKDIDVRFIELMPIGEVAHWSVNKFIPNTTVLDKVPLLESIKSKDIHAPASYYKLPGAKGKVGLISAISCKFCKDCNRLRLTSEGKLKYCLHSNNELDLKQLLKGSEDIQRAIQSFVYEKPLEHSIEQGNYVNLDMVRVGG